MLVPRDTSPGGDPSRNPLLRFDLSTLPANSIISSAELNLYSSSGLTEDFLLSSLENDSWVESTATWANYMPGNTKTLVGSLSAISAGYNAWDIDLTKWDYGPQLTDDTISFLMEFPEGTSWTTQAGFSSKEASSNHPFLSVEYSVAPEPVSTVLFLAGGAVLGLAGRRRKKR